MKTITKLTSLQNPSSLASHSLRFFSASGSGGNGNKNGSTTSYGKDTNNPPGQTAKTAAGRGKSSSPVSASSQGTTTFPSSVFEKRFKIDQYGLPLLNEKECHRRLEFATKMLQRLDKEKNLISSLVFSDEGNFRIFKDPSKRNKEQKPNESKNLPVIVWCGMTSRDIIGPYFFNSYVTESSYLRMVKSYMIPKLKELGYPLGHTWFQQDGAPPHRSKKVLKYLQQQFGTRLISYGCSNFWPAKSQDLTPLDYFLWDYLKAKVANNYRPTTTEDMKECICLELENIDPDLLEVVVCDFRNRLLRCIEANGQRFPAQNNYLKHGH